VSGLRAVQKRNWLKHLHKDLDYFPVEATRIDADKQKLQTMIWFRLEETYQNSVPILANSSFLCLTELVLADALTKTLSEVSLQMCNF
jgi:hypothetical protein